MNNFSFNHLNEIEAVSVKGTGSTFLQKIKKHYKRYAKTYNIFFGLLGLVVLVFSFKFKKK